MLAAAGKGGAVPADYAAWQAQRAWGWTPDVWDRVLRDYPGRIGRALHYQRLEAEGAALRHE